MVATSSTSTVHSLGPCTFSHLSHVENVEAKLHGESKVIQRCFDDNNDDNKK